MLLLPSQRVVQPQQLAPVERGNPLAKSLANALVPALYTTALGEAVKARGSNIGRTLAKTGAAASVSASQNGTAGSLVYPGLSWYAGNSGYTVSALLSIGINSATIYNLLSKYVNNGSGWRLYFENQTIKAAVTRSGATVVCAAPATTALDTPVLVSFVVHAATLDLYLDGVLVTSGVSHSSPSVLSTADLTLFYQSTNALLANKSAVYLTAVWARELNGNEIAALAENPWQLFAMPGKYLWASSQAHDLTGSGATQSAQSDSGAISQIQALAGNNATEATESSPGNITQTHLLAGIDATQAAVASDGSIVQTAVLSGDNVAEPAASSSGAVTQTQTVAGDNTAQANLADSGPMGQSHVLVADNATSTSASSSGGITQTHVLEGASANQTPSSTNGNITQEQTLAGHDAVQAASASGGAVSFPGETITYHFALGQPRPLTQLAITAAPAGVVAATAALPLTTVKTGAYYVN